MGLSRILGVLTRRWYVLVVGLLLSAGLGLGAVRISPPAYTAHGTILLLPSKEQLNAGGRNPFLHLDGLTGPAGIVIVRLDSDQNRAAIEALSPTAEYLVEPDPEMRGPGILVSVTDRTENGSLTTLDFLLNTVTATLREIQAERKVPNSATVGSMRLVVDTQAERQMSGTIRMVIVAVGVGLLVTFVAMVAIDALALRRRRATATRAGATLSDVDGSDEATRRSAPQRPKRAAQRPIIAGDGHD